MAHRAGNSLAGLEAAVTVGADVIEADVHLFQGRLEVRHLKTLGPLPFLWDTWQLVPAWRPRLALHELLGAVQAGTVLMLDVKGKDPSAGAAVARSIRDLDVGTRFLVCGRYWPALQAFRNLDGISTVPSARNPRELAGLLQHVRTAPPYGVSLHRSLLTARLVSRLHGSVERVMTWPVNDDAALREVLDLGVSGVISDEAEVLSRLRDLAEVPIGE